MFQQKKVILGQMLEGLPILVLFFHFRVSVHSNTTKVHMYPVSIISWRADSSYHAYQY